MNRITKGHSGKSAGCRLSFVDTVGREMSLLQMMPATDIEAAAAEWLIRIEEAASEAAQAQFKAWLAADARHHAAFLRLESVWGQADVLKKLRPLDGVIDENVLDRFGQAQPLPEQQPRKTRIWAGLLALLFVGVVGVAAWLAATRSEWHVYRTDRGGFQRVSLRDGSIALLNTSSEIRVLITPTQRRVIVSHGEVVFTVAHDEHRPFDVEAADTKIRAVGTAFEVRLREQKRVDVMVADGHVAIDPPDFFPAAADAATVSPATGGPAMVSPAIAASQPASLPAIATVDAGEAVSIKARRWQRLGLDADGIERRLAWTRGELVFDHATLAEAAAEFNRYNHRQLSIADPAIAAFQIGGSFTVSDLNSFVAALEKFGIRAVTTRQPQDPDLEVIRLMGANPQAVINQASAGPVPHN